MASVIVAIFDEFGDWDITTAFLSVWIFLSKGKELKEDFETLSAGILKRPQESSDSRLLLKIPRILEKHLSLSTTIILNMNRPE